MGNAQTTSAAAPTAAAPGLIAPAPAPVAVSASTLPASASSPAQIDKDEARVQRLRKSNSVKDKIYREWQKHCLKVCDDDVREYWLCREEHGFLTPLKCGDTNKAMQECLKKCGRDDAAYGAYKMRRLDEIEAEVLARIAREEAAAKQAAAAAAAGGATPQR